MTPATKTKEGQSLENQKPPEQKQRRKPTDASSTAIPPDDVGLQEKKPTRPAKRKYPNRTPRFSISPEALKRLTLVVIAYSHVEREFFPTEEAYLAEKEVEDRAAQVLEVMEKIGVPGQLNKADEYFLNNLLVDRPNLVLNLVDTLRGQDALQTSVPAALELVEIPYTGADMRGLVIGNDRNLFKQILQTNDIPTPDYQYIQRSGTKINPDLGLPLIVKLNESGGSVGIDKNAVKETLDEAQEQVNDLISTYHIPVIVERFVDGPEITAVVFEDSRRRHVFLGQKIFGAKLDGKHEFTSLESYSDPNSYHYAPVEDAALVKKIEMYVNKAFKALHNKDYSKYDIRVDQNTLTPYFTDCNPNTAFGPHIGLPFTEVLETLYGVKFEKVLAALLSKYAKKIKTRR